MAFQDILTRTDHGTYSWSQLPRTALLSRRLHDKEATDWLDSVAKYVVTIPHDIRHLQEVYSMRVLVDGGSAAGHPHLPVMKLHDRENVDFVIALGGDGTLLHVSSYFREIVPPVLAFSKGSLGFLMPFPHADWNNVVTTMIEKEFHVKNRLRLMCNITRDNGPDVSEAVINEVAVCRHGTNPLLLNIAVNGDAATSVLGDGVVAATATGSTAYSLSAGGSIIHPDVDGILLTPICPFSLSFRPLVLPSQTHLELHVPSTSRSAGYVSLDGRRRVELAPGDKISIRPSQYPIPCVELQSRLIDWFNNISQTLKWNINPTHY